MSRYIISTGRWIKRRHKLRLSSVIIFCSSKNSSTFYLSFFFESSRYLVVLNEVRSKVQNAGSF